MLHNLGNKNEFKNFINQINLIIGNVNQPNYIITFFAYVTIKWDITIRYQNELIKYNIIGNIRKSFIRSVIEGTNLIFTYQIGYRSQSNILI